MTEQRSITARELYELLEEALYTHRIQDDAEVIFMNREGPGYYDVLSVEIDDDSEQVKLW